MSDERIKAMSKDEVLARSSAVARARNTTAFDEATQTRLKQEFAALMQRVRTQS